MTQKFAVDWILCDGFGICGDLAPDLIDLDEWRYPIVRQGAIPDSRLHDAQRAVDCCPMKALRLIDADADDRGRGAPHPPPRRSGLVSRVVDLTRR